MSSCFPNSSSPAIRRKTWCSSRRCRKTPAPRSKRWRADTADGGPAILIGAPWVEEGKLYNAVLLLDGGKIAGMTFKHDLPNYGVFDEKRVFAPGPLPRAVAPCAACKLGVPVCEDIWTQDVTAAWPKRARKFCCVPNGSPFEAGKEDVRLQAGARPRVSGNRPAADLSQPAGRPGRAGVRRRQLCAECRRHARAGAAGLAREHSPSPTGQRDAARQMDLRAGRKFAATKSRCSPGLSRHDAGRCAIM